jgi:sulfur transfer protein SufE
MQNSNSEPHSSNMSASANNAVKKGQNLQNKEKNDIFYVKKRGLFRKAEQVVRYCNSDVFIIVHNKDSDKIFSFTSD